MLFSRGLQMRAYLLTTTATMALLAAMPAHAQDATWTGSTSGNWNHDMRQLVARDRANGHGNLRAQYRPDTNR